MQAELRIGDIVEAEVTRITDFGAFARIKSGGFGLIHISQISADFVKDINQHLKVGDKVKAKVTKIGSGNKVDLSLKKTKEKRTQKNNSGFKSSNFEEALQNFLGSSV